MSSAALHAVPPATQPYHVAMQASPAAVSPVSSRKARSPSGSTPQSPLPSHSQHQQQQQPHHPHHHHHHHHHQQQAQQQLQSSPAMPSPSSRGQASSSASHVSPVNRDVSPVPYESSYYNDRPEPDMSTSPYSSAYQHQQQQQQQRAYPDTPPSSRAVPSAQQYGSPHAGVGSSSDRDSTRGSPSQRREHPPSTLAGSGAGAEQASRSAPVHSRSSDAVGQPPVDSSLPREDSTIINRLVIADPQEDIERAQARVAESQGAMPPIGALSVDDSSRAGPRSRQEHLKTGQPRKETKFGEYILGQTLGEGEFGKVKMGWKKDGGVQVAIKLIRKESLGNNPNRLPKIYREIAILRELKHPNIVRLHEMVETERHIGIILEYASGGELFDYILNHRYLNDKAARRLFAQLVSGVGYLHKKGIVHRDLKLENLLLDRNKNIIITDFGFANTFNPADELGEEVERGLQDKEFVRRHGLDQILRDGHRRGDLMQTSCGSPCYAAPELVVSDSLYTGRKVDVWSCGVILYAMLAGYLPFDDDPANPEGDNINLLYKYIVTTPLTFPEYVTPHARDLLRRILVPDPRKRADLFEVARHSWLAEYAKVVEHVTSGATTVEEIANTTVPSGQHSRPPRPNTIMLTTSAEDPYAVPQLGRSASVREPSRSAQPASPGGLSAKHAAPIDPNEKTSQQREDRHKRSTLQVEYVAPNTSTARGGDSTPTALPPLQPAPPPALAAASTQSKTRARGDGTYGPVEVPSSPYQPSPASSRQQRPATQSSMAPPARPGREPPRAVSESTALSMNPPSSSSGRPTTAGTMDRVGGSRLPSRGNSYGQAIAPTVAATNAEGRFSQPKNSGYIISGSVPDGGSKRNSVAGRPVSQQLPADFQALPEGRPERASRGHRRSNTVESITSKIFGRSNSRRQSQGREDAVRPDKTSRAYPPLSMRNAMPSDTADRPRPSTDSGRQSLGFSRKPSDYAGQQQQQQQHRQSRRFSFLPTSFSRMSFSGPKNDVYDPGSRRGSLGPAPPSRRGSKAERGMAFGQGRSRSPSQSTTGSSIPVLYDSGIDHRQQNTRRMQQQQPPRGATAPDLSNFQDGSLLQQQYSRQASRQAGQPGYDYTPPSSSGQQGRGEQFFTPSQSHESQHTSGTANRQPRPLYPSGFNDLDQAESRTAPRQPAVLQKNRKFGEAYENGGNGGSSGGARRVMDWFRKRGKDRSG